MSETLDFQVSPSAKPPGIPPVHKEEKRDREQGQYWAPILSSLAVFVVIALLVAASKAGIPPLFEPEQSVLHGAVIIAIAIVGAALLAVRLQSLLTERRVFRNTEEDVADAREDIIAAQESLDRIDELVLKIETQEERIHFEKT